MLWFGRFSVVGWLFVFSLLLLLPCPFCLPAASLGVAAAVTRCCRRRRIEGPPGTGASLSLSTRGTGQEPQGVRSLL